MTNKALRDHLGMCVTTFYNLRRDGFIPAPTSGALRRKHYSTKEVEAIVQKLIAVGHIEVSQLKKEAE